MSKFVSTSKKKFAKFRRNIRTLSLLYPRRGQAVLSFVFLIGVIIVSIGATLAFLAASFLNSGYGFQAANRALALASAGAEDGLMQLARNKDFFAATPYSVPVGSDSASVTVNQNAPVSGQATIVSSATVFFRQRKIQVIVSINGATSKVDVMSWRLLVL